MTRDPQCTFCKIVAAEIPASVVYEDDEVLSFLDVGPLSDGHLLVIPRPHYARFHDLPVGLAAAMAAVLPRLSRAVLKVTGAAGINVLCNDGSAAGQVVPHVHVHLVPRREGDGLGFRWNAGKYPPGRADQLAASLQSALAGHGTEV
jgi:histidine triad (HIT) family protein